MNPKVAILAEYYFPAIQAGGPPRSIRERVLSASEVRLSVITRARDHKGGYERAYRGRKVIDGIPVHYLPHPFSAPGAWGAAIRRIWKADLVWINSLHSSTFAIAPLLWLGLAPRGPRILVSPRGELIPGHLAHHRYRKRVWHSVIRALQIHRRVSWLATTDAEAETIRQAFGTDRIHISPETSSVARTEFVPRVLGDTLQLLYLGRITPLKGLLEAVQMIGELRQPVNLTVAGPAHDSAYLAEVKDEVKGLPTHASVTWRGMVERDGIVDLIRSHDALLLPTTGESFGHSIAETLLLGRPVLTTATTPWDFGAEHGAVWFIHREDICGSARTIESFASVDNATAIRRQRASYWVGERGLREGLTLDEVVRRVL